MGHRVRVTFTEAEARWLLRAITLPRDHELTGVARVEATPFFKKAASKLREAMKRPAPKPKPASK